MLQHWSVMHTFARQSFEIEEACSSTIPWMHTALGLRSSPVTAAYRGRQVFITSTVSRTSLGIRVLIAELVKQGSLSYTSEL